MNTTASGVAVSGNVMHFPVCTRLRSDNFDFTNTLLDGSDIRFRKLDNTPLHYEIERWDTKSK